MEFNSQTIFGVLIVLLLPAVVLVTSAVQARIIERQKAVLADDTLRKAFDGCLSYVSAVAYFERRVAAGSMIVQRSYALPILSLIVVIVLFATLAWFGPKFEAFLGEPNYLLGGAYAIGKGEASKIALVQGQTVFCGSIAFLSAYLVIIYRLIVRINNNDIGPIAYYFFAFHIVNAVIMALIVRHVLLWAPLTGATPDLEREPYYLAAIGFVVGLRPDLWVTWIARKVYEMIGALQARKLDSAALPEDMDLVMIEGMSEEKRGRLSEMNIDTCHALAEANPFVLWARTTYNMPEIVDWSAQAMLYLLVKQKNTQRLRDFGIREIFGYLDQIKSDSAAAVIASQLGVNPQVLAKQAEAIESDPAFARLGQIRSKLRPDSPSR